MICRARVHTWTTHAPQPQTECPAAKRTSGIQLTNKAVEERSDCYDPAQNADTVLAYGHGFEIDGIRCISEQRGITCVRLADHIGFSISTNQLSHQPWDSPLLQQRPGTLGSSGTTRFPSGFHVSFVAADIADCLLAAPVASCLVRSDATAPPGDPACDLDQALTARVLSAARGELVRECRSDANGGQTRLRSGEAVQVGDLRCTASPTALRCAHLDGNKHGFVVDQKSFRGF